jgi:hypothetical protein
MMSKIPLGDDSPSTFLKNLRILANAIEMPDSFLRKVWFRQLPAEIRTSLNQQHTAHLSLNNTAALADRAFFAHKMLQPEPEQGIHTADISQAVTTAAHTAALPHTEPVAPVDASTVAVAAVTTAQDTVPPPTDPVLAVDVPAVIAVAQVSASTQDWPTTTPSSTLPNKDVTSSTQPPDLPSQDPAKVPIPTSQNPEFKHCPEFECSLSNAQHLPIALPDSKTTLLHRPQELPRHGPDEVALPISQEPKNRHYPDFDISQCDKPVKSPINRYPYVSSTILRQFHLLNPIPTRFWIKTASSTGIKHNGQPRPPRKPPPLYKYLRY